MKGREICLSVGKEHFLAVKKSIKRSRFVIYSYFKDSAYTASVKRDVKF